VLFYTPRYDKMLDTKGNTAVYLMFAYARFRSIVRKGAADFGIDAAGLAADGVTPWRDTAAAAGPAAPLEKEEASLVLELAQLPDVLDTVLGDLMPHRLCEHLCGVYAKPHLPAEAWRLFVSVACECVFCVCAETLVAADLCPNLPPLRAARYELCVKGTTFVTQCFVLDKDRPAVMRSRLVLCAATCARMKQIFSLIGIDPLDRI